MSSLLWPSGAPRLPLPLPCLLLPALSAQAYITPPPVGPAPDNVGRHCCCRPESSPNRGKQEAGYRGGLHPLGSSTSVLAPSQP
jgi:hypothetical protein